MDTGVTAQKVLTGYQFFFFSEIFRIRFLNRNSQESAEKC